MTSPTSLGTEQQHLAGRTVRDIVEYCPGQVNEVWCRKIFRQILQSLELQYAMHLPHRPVTPDTIVFHEGGEPLLVPSDLVVPGHKPGAPGDPLRDDLSALAGIVHYAITGELVPQGPLAGRGYADYSDSLVATVDLCMAPDVAQRPRTIEAVRALLGIVAPGPIASNRRGEPPFAEPVPAETPAAQEPAEAGTVDSAPDAPIGAAEASAAEASAAAALPAMPSAPEPAAARHAELAPAARPLRASASAGPQHAPAATLPPPAMPALPKVAARAGLGRGQRWAIAAGGAAVLLALGIVWYAELRDSASFDRIALTLPQRADAPAAAPANGQPPAPAAATAPPGSTAPSTGNPPQTPSPQAAAGAPALGDAATADAQAPTGAAAQSGAPGQAAGKAAYRLHIQPWGVVYVDGVDRGVSPPIKRLELAPGRHSVRVANPAFQDRVLEVDTARGDGRIDVDFNREAP